MTTKSICYKGKVHVMKTKFICRQNVYVARKYTLQRESPFAAKDKLSMSQRRKKHGARRERSRRDFFSQKEPFLFFEIK